MNEDYEEVARGGDILVPCQGNLMGSIWIASWLEIHFAITRASPTPFASTMCLFQETETFGTPLATHVLFDNDDEEEPAEKADHFLG